jgi:Zn-dependent protease
MSHRHPQPATTEPGVPIRSDWPFAAGFVALLFVHEMGHVIQLRREGVNASAPMFVPFRGAVISAKSLGRDALAEARVGLAGPVLGTVGAGIVALTAVFTHAHLLYALAYIGFFLNAFKLLPATPLDGGRAMAAMAPAMWVVGLLLLIAVAVLLGNPLILIFIVIGFLDVRRRLQQRHDGGPGQQAHYDVWPKHRLHVGWSTSAYWWSCSPACQPPSRPSPPER